MHNSQLETFIIINVNSSIVFSELINNGGFCARFMHIYLYNISLFLVGVMVKVLEYRRSVWLKY